ncbi:MAG: hypothetical protein U0946_03190, partial [Patescibacteria group bacterium]|nr:hypothetical protein [Patescibacteria group bacterium]
TTPTTDSQSKAEEVTVEVKEEKTAGKIPNWAKAHRDEVQPAKPTSKIPENIKVHDYREKDTIKEKPKKEKAPQEGLNLKPKKSDLSREALAKRDDEPNYWGKKLS